MVEIRAIAGPLPTSTRSVLERELSPLGLLQDVVRWAHDRAPPTTVVDVVVQDEFNHDVVIPWSSTGTDRLYLVFSTT